MRGGEKVLEAILELHPSADLFTLFHFAGSVSKAIEQHRIHVSPLQKAANAVSDYRLLLPFFPIAAATWNLSGYDLVISSSHCVAKNVRVGTAPHLSYCHTPMRYIWDRFDDYFPRDRKLVRAAMSLLAPMLRRTDVSSSSRVTRYVSNSDFVGDRIRKYYGRTSETIYPFADEMFFESADDHARDDYHLVVSALVPYKRIDLAITAAAGSGRRLIVVGEGPAARHYQALAGSRIEFAGRLSSEEIVNLMARARSLIIPGVEDFGITAVEALAQGTPVIGTSVGGVRETIDGGTHGELFSAGDAASLVLAIERVEARSWDRAILRERAARFTKKAFQTAISAAIGKMLNGSDASEHARTRR